MGYPVITRLGINQFWYKHWYSDIFYGDNLKLNSLLPKLLKLYINYGLTTSNNFFFNKFFFNEKKNKSKPKTFSENLKFYRKFFYSNKMLNIEHSYFLRIKTSEYFPFRVWLISYCGWLVLCFSCYKPLKNPPVKKTITKKEVNSANTDFSYSSHKHVFNRYKLVYTHALLKLLKSYSYCF